MVFFTVCVVILCFLLPAAAVWAGSNRSTAVRARPTGPSPPARLLPFNATSALRSWRFLVRRSGPRRYGLPHRATHASRTKRHRARRQATYEMSAVPVHPPLAPARRLADLAHSQLLRVALGASALVAISALLARRVDLSSIAESDIVWGWIAVSLALNLASVAGKAIVWKAALDALPGQRPVRYGHVVPALFIGFLLNTVLFARIGEVARVAVLGRRRRLSGEPIPASTIAGTVLAEQLVLGRRAGARDRRARAGAAPAAHGLAARDRVHERARDRHGSC